MKHLQFRESVLLSEIAIVKNRIGDAIQKIILKFAWALSDNYVYYNNAEYSYYRAWNNIFKLVTSIAKIVDSEIN
jgi:hypothetical protein